MDHTYHDGMVTGSILRLQSSEIGRLKQWAGAVKKKMGTLFGKKSFLNQETIEVTVGLNRWYKVGHGQRI